MQSASWVDESGACEEILRDVPRFVSHSEYPDPPGPVISAWEKFLGLFPNWVDGVPLCRSDFLSVPLNYKPSKQYKGVEILRKLDDGREGTLLIASRKSDGSACIVYFKGENVIFDGRLHYNTRYRHVMKWAGHFLPETVALKPIFFGELVALDKDGNELGHCAVGSVMASLEKYPLGSLIEVEVDGEIRKMSRTTFNAPYLAVRIFGLYEVWWCNDGIAPRLSLDMLSTGEDQLKLLDALVPEMRASVARVSERRLYRIFVERGDSRRIVALEKKEFDNEFDSPEAFIRGMEKWAERECWEGVVVNTPRLVYLLPGFGKASPYNVNKRLPPGCVDSFGYYRCHASFKIKHSIDLCLGLLKFEKNSSKGYSDFYILYGAKYLRSGEYVLEMCGQLDIMRCHQEVRKVLNKLPFADKTKHMSLYDSKTTDKFASWFQGFVCTGNLELFRKFGAILIINPSGFEYNLQTGKVTPVGFKFVKYFPRKYSDLDGESAVKMKPVESGIPEIEVKDITFLDEAYQATPYYKTLHERWKRAHEAMELFTWKEGGARAPVSSSAGRGRAESAASGAAGGAAVRASIRPPHDDDFGSVVYDPSIDLAGQIARKQVEREALRARLPVAQSVPHVFSVGDDMGDVVRGSPEFSLNIGSPRGGGNLVRGPRVLPAFFGQSPSRGGASARGKGSARGGGSVRGGAVSRGASSSGHGAQAMIELDASPPKASPPKDQVLSNRRGKRGLSSPNSPPKDQSTAAGGVAKSSPISGGSARIRSKARLNSPDKPPASDAFVDLTDEIEVQEVLQPQQQSQSYDQLQVQRQPSSSPRESQGQAPVTPSQHSGLAGISQTRPPSPSSMSTIDLMIHRSIAARARKLAILQNRNRVSLGKVDGSAAVQTPGSTSAAAQMAAVKPSVVAAESSVVAAEPSVVASEPETAVEPEAPIEPVSMPKPVVAPQMVGLNRVVASAPVLTSSGKKKKKDEVIHILIYFDSNGFETQRERQEYLRVVPQENMTDDLYYADIVIYRENAKLKEDTIRVRTRPHVQIVSSTRAAMRVFDKIMHVGFKKVEKMYHVDWYKFPEREREGLYDKWCTFCSPLNRTTGDRDIADVVLVPRDFELTPKFMADFPPYVKVIHTGEQAKKWCFGKVFFKNLDDVPDSVCKDYGFSEPSIISSTSVASVADPPAAAAVMPTSEELWEVCNSIMDDEVRRDNAERERKLAAKAAEEVYLMEKMQGQLDFLEKYRPKRVDGCREYWQEFLKARKGYVFRYREGALSITINELNGAWEPENSAHEPEHPPPRFNPEGPELDEDEQDVYDRVCGGEEVDPKTVLNSDDDDELVQSAEADVPAYAPVDAPAATLDTTSDSEITHVSDSQERDDDGGCVSLLAVGRQNARSCPF